MNWCTIESDPGLFTELISSVGIKDVMVSEVYDLEGLGGPPPFGGDPRETYGLIFLFKWKAQREDRPVADVPGLFFAKQTVSNACATQAILSVLLNAENVDLGDVMTSFKSFTQDFPPDLRGEAIGSCAPLREAHNSFARPEPFEIQTKVAQDDDDVFHFIGYVPYKGCVYELDGLKKGPIELAKIEPGQSWLVPVREIIKKRINLYVASEIRFNLLEVTQDLRSQWRKQIDELEKVVAGSAMDTGADGSNPAAELQELQAKLAAEDDKFQSWRDENTRRRHNYVPFIMQLLTKTGEAGHLSTLLTEAREKESERQARKQRKK